MAGRRTWRRKKSSIAEKSSQRIPEDNSNRSQAQKTRETTRTGEARFKLATKRFPIWSVACLEPSFGHSMLQDAIYDVVIPVILLAPVHLFNHKGASLFQGFSGGQEQTPKRDHSLVKNGHALDCGIRSWLAKV